MAALFALSAFDSPSVEKGRLFRSRAYVSLLGFLIIRLVPHSPVCIASAITAHASPARPRRCLRGPRVRILSKWPPLGKYQTSLTKPSASRFRKSPSSLFPLLPRTSGVFQPAVGGGYGFQRILLAREVRMSFSTQKASRLEQRNRFLVPDGV